MDKYLKMADAFGDVVTQKLVGDAYEIVSDTYGHVCVVNTAGRADIVAHAINSHDELVGNMQHYKREAERWEAIAVKEASMVQEFDLEVERLRRQLHFCEASRGQLIDQINRMKRDVFEGKHQQKPYL